METKELEKIENTTDTTDVVVEGADLSNMFVADAGGGLENATSEDYAVPFLVILQKGSPQVSRANAKYIRGAEQGMIYNTVTSETFRGELGIDFIPCAYSSSVVEWRPRETGGGLVGHHKKSDQIVQSAKVDPAKKKLVAQNGNLLIDTSYHFGLAVVDGSPSWSVIGMSSTQRKVSRHWNTKMANLRMPNGSTYPTYSHIYHLTTKPEQRDQFDWFGWCVGDPTMIRDVKLYIAARDFAKQVLSGGVRMSTPTDDVDVDQSSQPQNGQDDQVPF